MKENKIGGIPIIDDHQKLVGILTNRDLRFEEDRKRKIREVMTNDNLIVAPEGTDLKMAETILRKHKVEKLPVVNKSGKLIGLITYRDILQLSSFPNAVKDDFGRLRVEPHWALLRTCWTGPPLFCRSAWMWPASIVHTATTPV